MKLFTKILNYFSPKWTKDMEGPVNINGYRVEITQVPTTVKGRWSRETNRAGESRIWIHEPGSVPYIADPKNISLTKENDEP